MESTTTTTMSTDARPVYQPIHADIRGRLDPEYVQLHDAVLQYCPRLETLPWAPGSRKVRSPMANGNQRLSDVGFVADRTVGADGDVQARVFTPTGTSPPSGWPCLVWYHGGGWVVGGLASENGFLTHLCRYVGCIVISINYRHAPEHVYPVAADDSYAGLEWVLSPETVAELHLDTAKIALGGLSAGGGLASIVGLKAAQAGFATTVRPCLQMLICPVIDNTATVESAWGPSRHAPWLTPARMQWYRRKYFGDDDSTQQPAEWTASPCFAPVPLLAQSPPTFFGIAGCDLLAPEDMAFADQLRAAGVPVDVHTYPGATHSVLILAGIHQTGKKLVHDAAAALARAFGTSYDPAAAPVLGQVA